MNSGDPGRPAAGQPASTTGPRRPEIVERARRLARGLRAARRPAPRRGDPVPARPSRRRRAGRRRAVASRTSTSTRRSCGGPIPPALWDDLRAEGLIAGPTRTARRHDRDRRRRPPPPADPAPRRVPVADRRARGDPSGAFGPDDLAPAAGRGRGRRAPSSSRRARASTRRASFLATAAARPFIAGRRRLGRPDGPGGRRRDRRLRARPGGGRPGRDPPPGPRRARSRTGCCGRTSGGASRPSARPASPTTCSCRPRELPAALDRRPRAAAAPVRHRPPRQAADPRPATREPWADAHAAVRRPAERRVQALRARHRGRLGAWTVDDLAPVRRRRPRDLRPGAAALRVRLAGLPGRRLVRRTCVVGCPASSPPSCRAPSATAIFGGAAGRRSTGLSSRAGAGRTARPPASAGRR